VEVVNQLKFNVLFRYFVGLKAEDSIPDDTSLVVFRKRLGEKLFERIFDELVKRIGLKPGEKLSLGQLSGSVSSISPKVYTIDQSYIQRIEDDSARSLYSNILDRLKELGIELRPTSNHTISGFFEGERILRFYPKNKFFSVRFTGIGKPETGRIRIQNEDDWKDFFEEYLKPKLDETQ
jgi:IS5 family transposase